MTVNIDFHEIPPALFGAMKAVEDVVESSGLSKSLVELVYYYVATTKQCGYCIDMHFKEAQAQGVELRKLYSITVFDKVDYFSNEELACLNWARGLISQPNGQDMQSLFIELASLFSSEEIAKLSLAISHICSWTQLMIAFAIPAGNYQVGQFK
jgi:AhpD family alkylhydroperoxidase